MPVNRLLLFLLILLIGCKNLTERKTLVSDPTASSQFTNEVEIRRQGNHLRDTSSLYLLQHAHNPVDWYPWGEEALTLARVEDKPIFLSIGYSSCHWCHVMEREVFENDTIAAYLNRHFVCIKVDREERPDLDGVYMQAVQLMTGSGGWPLSVFLTPELEPFYGGTYFPPEQFTRLTEYIVELFQERRGDVRQQGAELAQVIGQSLPTSIGGIPTCLPSKQFALI